MKYISRPILMLLVSLFLKPSLITSANTSITPLLYYYSEERSAFIIEDAAGVNSQLFAETDLYNIFGPGWSPSGNWFVWAGTQTDTGFQTITAIQKNGEQRSILLGDIEDDVTNLVWAPRRDILSIGVLTDYDRYRYLIIDLDSREILVEVELTDKRVSYVEWAPGGDFFVIYYTQSYSTSLWNEYPPMMMLVSTDGTIEEYPIGLSACDSNALAASWFGDFSVVYPTRDQQSLTIENVQTSTSYTTDFNTQPQVVHTLEWNLDYSYAMVETYPDCTENPRSVWLLSTQNQRLDYWTRGVISWAWSPSTNQIAALSDEYSLLLLDPISLSSFETSLPANQGTNIINAQFKWSPDGTYLLLIIERTMVGSEIYTYDIASRQFTSLLATEDMRSIHDFEFSPTGDYVAFTGLCRLQNLVCIYDLTHGTLAFIQPHPESVYDISDLFWHEDGSWLISAERSGFVTRLVKVSNATGTIQRDLTLCTATPSCFGWMPQN